MPYTRMVTRLKATSAVTALVGTRVHPGFAPSNTLPAIVYDVTSDEPENHSTGTTATHCMRIEVTSYAATYAGAKALAAAVETALSGWNDSTGAVWHLDSSADDSGEVQAGANVLTFFAVVQQYQVWYATS